MKTDHPRRQQQQRPSQEIVNDLLSDIYYNYGEEGALNNNIKTLRRLIKERNDGLIISEAQIREFLTTQPGYTVHRRVRKLQFPRRQIHVSTARVRADGDLIELGDLKPWNNGFSYIFTVIDAFSRYLWARAIKNKEASTTAAALQSMVKEDKFHSISFYTDGGKEFAGAPFQSVLKSAGMKHRICSSTDWHCPFVERVQRTMKEKLFQTMTSNHTRRWIQYLPQVVDSYNKSIHSSTKMRPIEARLPENCLSVMKQLELRRYRGQKRGGKLPYRFKPGDLVRILLDKGGPLGKKGYLPRFSWEIFRVKKQANDRILDGIPGRAGHGHVPAYTLEDLNGEVIEHALFYEPELSKVHQSQLDKAAPIREILEEKNDMIKVWWQGFPKSSAEWISRKNLL